MREERSVDQVHRQNCSNGMYGGGRWRWRCDSGNWCADNGRGKVLDWDVFVESKGEERLMLDNVRGVGGNGGDWVREFVNEMIVGGGKILVINDGGVGELDD